jgi:hypothetical protein
MMLFFLVFITFVNLFLIVFCFNFNIFSFFITTDDLLNQIADLQLDKEKLEIELGLVRHEIAEKVLQSDKVTKLTLFLYFNMYSTQQIVMIFSKIFKEDKILQVKEVLILSYDYGGFDDRIEYVLFVMQNFFN